METQKDNIRDKIWRLLKKCALILKILARYVFLTFDIVDLEKHNFSSVTKTN